MIKLLEFDFTLEYKKGKDNIVADALSRKYQLNAISLVTPKWTNEVEKSYETDSKCRELLEKLLVSPNHTDQNDSLQNGLIRHKGRIYIGDDLELKNKLLNALHSSALGGHSGRKVMRSILRSSPWTPHRLTKHQEDP